MNIKREQPPLSQAEIEVLNLEQRRTSAESALEETSKAVKALQEKADKLNLDIEIGYKTIEDNNAVIEKNKNDISSLQEEFRLTSQSLDETKRAGGEKLKEILNDIETKTKDKEDIEATITSLNDYHEKNKATKFAEIKDLESRKSSISSEINTLSISKESILKEIEDAKKELESIQMDVDAKKVEKVSAETYVQNLKDQLSSQKTEIENNKVVLNTQASTISGKEIEISDLDKKIADKQEEYTSLEGKAFGILHREELLNQKEAFIKSQFDRAGISYEK
jgi:chromosome segregation ATPase